MIHHTRTAPTGPKYSPYIGCEGCRVTFCLNRCAPTIDGPKMRELENLLASIARADGWYTKPDGEWLCNTCAPSAVERLGELADDRS